MVAIRAGSGKKQGGVRVNAANNGHDAFYRKQLQNAVETHGPTLKGLGFVDRWRERGAQIVESQKKKGAAQKDFGKKPASEPAMG